MRHRPPLTALTALSALAITASLLLNVACQKKGEVIHFREEKTAAPTGTNSPQAPHAGSMTETASAPYGWILPEGWSDQPASGMRLATVIIPISDNTLNASITEFGGDLAGNVNRWRGQVGLPSLPEAEILSSLEKVETSLGLGYIVTLINPASPTKAMLAAIIPRPSGTSVFIKVTGTSDELKLIAEPFRAFTKSFKQ